MSDNREYQVGPYWLARDTTDGPYKICWYDKAKRKVRRKTTGSSALHVAIEAITQHHLENYRAPSADERTGMTVRQVAIKYWIEHGKNLTASSTCRTSLDKLNRFLSAYEGDGPELLANNWTRDLTRDFIAWMRDNPSMSERHIRDEKGNIIETHEVPRPQTDKTINRHLDDVRAAFRFCMDRPPIIKGIQGAETREGRKKPTLSLQQVKDLFAYAFATPERKHFQNYLMIAFTTLARPSAIIDLCVAPERGQVEWDYRLIHFNPEGRKQTKKHRPTVPINDYLLPVIQEALDRYEESRLKGDDSTQGYLVEFRGKPVASVRQTWNRAKKALGWPLGGDLGRDWDAKMIRHTMSKYLRAQGAPWPEIEGQLGHNINSQSATYAEYEPDYLGRVQAEITRYMAQVCKGQQWPCTPLAPHQDGGVVSIKSKSGGKSRG